MSEPTHVRWTHAVDSRTRPFHGIAPPMPDPADLIDGRYLTEMERRIMQGRYNCRGEYVLAPPREEGE